MSLILQSTPDATPYTVVIGTCIRKPVEVVRAYLDHLAKQELPPGVRVQYDFVIDSGDQAVLELVAEFVETHGGEWSQVEPEGPSDFSDDHPQTHQWSQTAMARVGRLKNGILARAKALKADAVWLCDADLLCDDRTLRSLWYADAPIACAVYWTRWHNDPKIKVAPQVWLRHPYDLTGRGYPDEAAFRARLLTRQLTTVWGQGACTLIRRQVLEMGVDFSYLDGVSREGMMGGEDRHFCLHAESKHIPMVADPWPHIFHIYHPQDRERIAEEAEALTRLREHPVWVSLKLTMMEPVPTAPGQFGHMPPIHWRGRLGSGDLLPDLLQQILDHIASKSPLPFVAQVNYPSTHPIAWVRNTRRLIEVLVVDWKSEAPMPGLRDEVVHGFDLSLYSTRQQEAMA